MSISTINTSIFYGKDTQTIVQPHPNTATGENRPVIEFSQEISTQEIASQILSYLGFKSAWKSRAVSSAWLKGFHTSEHQRFLSEVEKAFHKDVVKKFCEQTADGRYKHQLYGFTLSPFFKGQNQYLHSDGYYFPCNRTFIYSLEKKVFGRSSLSITFDGVFKILYSSVESAKKKLSIEMQEKIVKNKSQENMLALAICNPLSIFCGILPAIALYHISNRSCGTLSDLAKHGYEFYQNQFTSIFKPRLDAVDNDQQQIWQQLLPRLMEEKAAFFSLHTVRLKGSDSKPGPIRYTPDEAYFIKALFLQPSLRPLIQHVMTPEKKAEAISVQFEDISGA